MVSRAARRSRLDGDGLDAPVRPGDDRSTITSEQEYGPYRPSPVDLRPLPATRYLLVEILLRTDDPSHSPVLSGYRVRYTCRPEL